MILLFGGTSETADIATSLADLGFSVLVSTATDAELNVGSHPLIARRCGRLDGHAMAALIAEQEVRLVIDAGHPYAIALHETVAEVAQKLRIPCLRYQRQHGKYDADNLFEVADHEEAAQLAASFGTPILLTSGSRNLAPYVKAAQEQGVPLFARVLPHPDSKAACDEVGLPESNRIFARGPFSVEQNHALIADHRIGVMVTKESGPQGGVAEKIAAARQEDCLVILIRRPELPRSCERICVDLPSLLGAVKELA